MKSMNLMALDNVDHLVHPEEFNEIGLHSPALSLIADFRQYQPRVIDSDTPAFRARYLMRKAHTPLRLVVDLNGEFIGLISMNELSEQNFMLQQARGLSRDDILVRDLMVPRKQIKALPYQELEHASIGDVMETLKQNRQRFCLVLDPEHHQIRGVISADDISTRVNVPLEIGQPDTFMEIFRAMRS